MARKSGKGGEKKEIDEYPFSDLHLEHFETLAGVTLRRSKTWISAVVAERNKETGEVRVSEYKWRSRGGSWKQAAAYHINDPEHLVDVVGALQELKGYFRSVDK